VTRVKHQENAEQWSAWPGCKDLLATALPNQVLQKNPEEKKEGCWENVVWMNEPEGFCSKKHCYVGRNKTLH